MRIFNKQVVDWHKRTFPKCTKTRQYCKLIEELYEYVVSGFDLEEKADVFIVLTVLRYRYNVRWLDQFRRRMIVPILLQAAQDKMEVNVTRIWSPSGHHKG